VAALVGVFLLLWVGVTLLLDAGSNRRAAHLVERLRPYRPPTDDAHRWADRQAGRNIAFLVDRACRYKVEGLGRPSGTLETAPGQFRPRLAQAMYQPGACDRAEDDAAQRELSQSSSHER
jgi:hypothetical protein